MHQPLDGKPLNRDGKKMVAQTGRHLTERTPVETFKPGDVLVTEGRTGPDGQAFGTIQVFVESVDVPSRTVYGECIQGHFAGVSVAVELPDPA